MKCDTCVHMKSEMPGYDYPYPILWCSEDHWDGIDLDEPEPEVDPWENCEDYEAIL